MKVYVLTMAFQKVVFSKDFVQSRTNVLGVFLSTDLMLELISDVMQAQGPDYKPIEPDDPWCLRAYQRMYNRDEITYIYFDALEKEVLNE